MEARNSALPLVLVRRLRRSSMASTVESGLRTLRRTQTRLSSSGGSRSSSLRVPERWMSMAGGARLLGRGGDECERATLFDVARGGEEAARALQSVGVDTAGEHFAGRRRDSVVGASE